MENFNDCPLIDTNPTPTKLKIHCNGQDIYLPDSLNSVLFIFTDNVDEPLEISQIGMKDLFKILKGRTDSMVRNFDLLDRKALDNADKTVSRTHP